MNSMEAGQVAEILDRVKEWPPESRIVLARRILETLDYEAAPTATPTPRSVQDLIGIGAGRSTPPDDETVRRWIGEHRAEKYG